MKYVRLKQNQGRNSSGITIGGIPKIFKKGIIAEVSDEVFEKIEAAKSLDFFDVIEEEEFNTTTDALNKKQKDQDKYKTKIKKYHDLRVSGLTDVEAREKAKIGAKEEIDEGVVVGGIKIEEKKEAKKEVKPAEPVEPKKPILGEDKIYTQEEAYDLDYDEQVVILKKRSVNDRDIKQLVNESDLVKKIIETNPEA